jgi:uncharacterized protein YjbK
MHLGGHGESKAVRSDRIRDEILSFDLEGKLLQVFGSLGTARDN